jgi:hypothetical protein
VSSYLAQGRYTLFVRIAGNHSVATVFASPKTPVIVKGGVTTLSAVSPVTCCSSSSRPTRRRPGTTH